MTSEIIEYIAENGETLEVKKVYLTKDEVCKKRKFLDLRDAQLDGRYWYGARKLFDYLILHKGYVEMM